MLTAAKRLQHSTPEEEEEGEAVEAAVQAFAKQSRRPIEGDAVYKCDRLIAYMNTFTAWRNRLPNSWLLCWFSALTVS
jgi:hypothetical protein